MFTLAMLTLSHLECPVYDMDAENSALTIH